MKPVADNTSWINQLIIPLYTDAIPDCENLQLVMHGITQSKLKLLRIFIKIEYNRNIGNNRHPSGGTRNYLLYPTDVRSHAL